MAVNRLVYKRTLDRELNKGTSLEKAMKIATTAGEKTTKGMKAAQKKPTLVKKIKRLFRRKGKGKGSKPQKRTYGFHSAKMK